jgi:hypothetical protein
MQGANVAHAQQFAGLSQLANAFVKSGLSLDDN